MDTLRMLVMAALIFSAFTALTEADDSQFSLRGSDSAGHTHSLALLSESL